eukprot:2750544-Alexandrium_andersonii.AAC.1
MIGTAPLKRPCAAEACPRWGCSALRGWRCVRAVACPVSVPCAGRGAKGRSPFAGVNGDAGCVCSLASRRWCAACARG